jgi:predicted nucleic acid-binding protein
MLVIDSSAVVKFFSRERGWEEIDRYIEDSATLPFAVIEFGNAMVTKVIAREVDAETAAALVDGYSRKAILVDQKDYVKAAMEIAAANNLTVYDSIFIAAALIGRWDLVSCDRKQVEVARKLGVNAIMC